MTKPLGNRSTISAYPDIVCGVGGCTVTFGGRYGAQSMGAHRLQKHGIGKNGRRASPPYRKSAEEQKRGRERPRGSGSKSKPITSTAYPTHAPATFSEAIAVLEVEINARLDMLRTLKALAGVS